MSSLVVFDLDGTLIDSRRDLADSANDMLVGYGACPLAIDQIAGMVGDGARELVARALRASELDVDLEEALGRFLEVYDRRLLIHTRLYDGLADTVRSIAGRSGLAVLTNKPEGPSRRLLAALEIAPYFHWVLGGDSGFPRKPDPAGLRHLMEEARAPRTRTLLVGDSMVDVETARRAETPMCVALYGFGQLRAPLALYGDEFVARVPGDVRGILEGFLTSAASSARR